MVNRKDYLDHPLITLAISNSDELIRGIESLQSNLDLVQSDFDKLSLDHAELERAYRIQQDEKLKIEGVLESAKRSVAELASQKNTHVSEIQKLASESNALRIENGRLNQEVAQSVNAHAKANEKAKNELEELNQKFKTATENNTALSAELVQVNTALNRTQEISAQEIKTANANLDKVQAQMNSVLQNWQKYSLAKEVALKAKDQEIVNLREEMHLAKESNERLFKFLHDAESSKNSSIQELSQEIELNRCQLQWANEELEKSIRTQETARKALRDQINELKNRNEELAVSLSAVEQEKNSIHADMSAQLVTQVLTLQESHIKKKQEREWVKSSARALASAIHRFSKEVDMEIDQDNTGKILTPNEARQIQIARGNRFLETLENEPEVNS